MMMWISLSLSLAVNVFAFLYVRWVLAQFNNLNNDLKVIFQDLVSYEEHVRTLHDSELFYGDSNLQALIEHTKKISSQIEQYTDYLFLEEKEEYEEYETGYDEETKED